MVIIKVIIEKLGFNRKEEIKEFQSAIEGIFDKQVAKIGHSTTAEFISPICTNLAILLEDVSGKFVPKAYIGFKDEYIKKVYLNSDSALITMLKETRHEIFRSQIGGRADSEPLVEDLDILNAKVCFPIRAYDWFFGLLVLGGNRWNEHRFERYESQIRLFVATMGLFLANSKLRDLKDKPMWGSKEAEKLAARYKDDPDFHIFCQKMRKYRDEFFDKEEENKNWQSLEFEKRLYQVAMNFSDSLREGKTKEEALADLVIHSGTKYDPLCVEAAVKMLRKGII